MRFDPMTGEPIEDGEPQVNQAPVYEQPVEPNKKKWLIPALIGGGVVVVAVIAVAVLVMSGAFMSDSMKVATAVANTVKDTGSLEEVVTPMVEILLEKESTTYVSGDYSGVEINAEYRNTKSDKQLWVLADISGLPEIEGTATLTKDELQLKAPIAGDDLFVYNYTGDNDGYLVDSMGKANVELLNKVLEIVYSGTGAATDEDTEAAVKKASKELVEWYKAIEFEKVDKEEFEIDGKVKKCAGYEVVVTEDMLDEAIDIYGDILFAYVENSDVDGADDAVDNMLDQFESEIDGMQDVEVTFYLDSNKLAGLTVEVGSNEAEIFFLGGDYRCQNMVVEANGNEIMEIEGEMDGNVEVMELSLAGDGTIVYEYDTKNGDFKFAVESTSGTELMTIDMIIINENNRVAFEDGVFAMQGQEIDFEFAVEKGAKIEKFEGDVFDIGNASESDLQEVILDIYQEMY